jgi:hypothetical protein
MNHDPARNVSNDHLTESEVLAGELELLGKPPAVDGQVNDVGGLALSGGGIRSATFGLGVLEGLKELGLLETFDYLSTVSGGGYIGSWLSANCTRNPGWLKTRTSWLQSIAHLRRYSNYLSPELGLFSADTWCMVTIWLRNTLLVQATVIAAIAVILLAPRLLFHGFETWPRVGDWRWTTVVLLVLAVAGTAGNQLRLNRQWRLGWRAGLFLALLLIAAAWLIIGKGNVQVFADDATNLPLTVLISFLLVAAGFFLQPVAIGLVRIFWKGSDRPEEFNYTQLAAQALIIVPTLATAYLTASVLWEKSLLTNHPIGGLRHYSEFFMGAWKYWPLPLPLAFASLWMLSVCSIKEWKSWKGWCVAFLAPIPAVIVLHALLCVIMLLLHGWAAPEMQNEGAWLAFAWAPGMVLYTFTLTIFVLIGIMGRDSSENVREWWSRLGAWLGIYGAAWTIINLAAIYGPRWGALILDIDTWQSYSVVGGWLGTTIAGLFAGKSQKTGGTPKSRHSEPSSLDRAIGWLAKIGPFVYIAGLLIAVSICVHLILVANAEPYLPGIAELDTEHWRLLSSPRLSLVAAVFGAAALVLVILAWRVDINEFSLNAFYRNRLVRCYLGATRIGQRKPQNFTGFDEKDDLPMADLQGCLRPMHIVNCALNLGGSSDLTLHTRHSASFAITPYVVGSGYTKAAPHGAGPAIGYRATARYGGENDRPSLGDALSVSGAAASPNMGYHTSPVVAFVMTMFNARLGRWFPNPNRDGIASPSPWFSLRYLFKELFGGADDDSRFLMVSDGGHFENLAAYELVRRKCELIVISDAECDPDLHFGGLGTLIRMCQVDFGATISIDTTSIALKDDPDWSARRWAAGTITYRDGAVGYLLYLKASMTGKEDTPILQYKASQPSFPHESTGNQFYTEDQFESYRALGKEIVLSALRR